MCNCEENKCYHISMGCVEPVVANANHYYTKSEVDEKLEDIITSGCCITPEEVDEKIASATSGYATEQWVLDKHYISGVDLSDYATKEYVSGYTYDKQTIDSKIASGGTFDPTQYYTTGQTNSLLNNKLDVSAYTPCDLSNYYNKQEIDAKFDDNATKTWVTNNYATISELIQYINNLQIQINSLQNTISGCCGTSSGETIYRWITMTGENDYECSGTTKMTEEKKQQSTDNGVTWSDVSPIETRTGDTVLEENCPECGYVPINYKFRGNLLNGNTVEIHCDSSTTLSSGETSTYNAYTSIEIGNCVSVIGGHAFQNQVFLSGNLILPSSIRTIGENAFGKCDRLSAVTFNNGLETIGQGAFVYDTGFTSVNIPDSVTTIGEQAFYLHELHTITIGSGITSIGLGAFETTDAKVQDVEYVKILATTPPSIDDASIGSYTFKGSYPIYVPSTSVNAYKSAWIGYASRIQAIPNA